MADSTTLPGARAALTSGGDTTSREFYTFFQSLSLVSGLPAKVDDLTVRVKKLEDGGGGVTRVQGLQSITSNGTGIVQLTLQNDQESVDPVYYYGTDSAGTKGWNLLFNAFADTSNIDAINTSGIISFDLNDLTDSGAGSLLATTFDAKGRKIGSRDATITGTDGHIAVANGNASAGPPTIDLDASLVALIDFLKAVAPNPRVTSDGSYRITADGAYRVTA